MQAAKNIGDEVDFCVPSGNFGNVLSAYFAKQMGLPIRRLIVATNENDVLHRLIQTGVYTQTKTQVTSSPSMDISKASNYERLAFDILGRDPAKLKEYMETFEKTGSVDLKEFDLSANIFKEFGFESGASTHQDRLTTIKHIYDTCGRVIDTHTADAVGVGLRAKHDDVPMVCMSTALPVKFETSVQEALGFVPERPARFKDTEQAAANAFHTIDTDAEQLKNYIRSNQK